MNLKTIVSLLILLFTSGLLLGGTGESTAESRYASADREGKGYVLGVETSLIKIRRDKPFQGTLGGSVNISACRHEYEAAQVVIAAYDRMLRNVSVSVSALKGPHGAKIGAGSVTLNRVDYVHTRKPEYEVDYVGWYPDPLMGIEPFDVYKGEVQPIWVTVYVPDKTPSGMYKGHLTVKPGNAPETVLPIKVQVWNFALPKTPNLITAFSTCEGQLGAWYGGLTPEIRHTYYDFLLKHRINPTNIYSTVIMPTKEEIEFCIEHGMNAFNICYINKNYDEKERAELLKQLKDLESFLKEKGCWDMAYVYGFDEPNPAKYPDIREMFGWIKENFPDLPRVCTVYPCEELKGYVDIWVPLTGGYNPQIAAEYIKNGDEFWWYVACIPHHPYPNWFTDYPAIDQRILPWMNWKQKIPAILYYAINLWTSNSMVDNLPDWVKPHPSQAARAAIRAGKRWPEVSWNTFTFGGYNGDGDLIYPGPGGKPISSIRLECIRDGIEDYDYFCILNDLYEQAGKSSQAIDPALMKKARRLLLINDNVVANVITYTKDPAVLLDARLNMADTIEKLTAAQTIGGK